MHDALLGKIIGRCIVVRASVIPNRHRMGRPLEANLVLKLTDLMIEVVQWLVTAGGFEANQVLGKAFIDKQKPPSRDRVVCTTG